MSNEFVLPVTADRGSELPIWQAIPDYADLFTFEDFHNAVKNLAYNEDDGVGYYATADEVIDVQVNLNSFRGETIKDIPIIPTNPQRSLTHVAWFNK